MSIILAAVIILLVLGGLGAALKGLILLAFVLACVAVLVVLLDDLL